MAVEPLTKHPAKFSPEVIDVLRVLVRAESRRQQVPRPLVLDSFGGVGRIHQLDDIAVTQAVELRPRWAACHARTRCGDATRLPHWWSRRFHVWATSPCYGNRLRDHHEARDTCKNCDGRGGHENGDGARPCAVCKGSGRSVRRSYAHDYGEPFTHANDAGVLRFGTAAYDRLHLRAYQQAHRCVVDGGGALLNVSAFVERKEMVDTVPWHRDAMRSVGWRYVRTVPVVTKRMTFGANRERAPHEVVLVFRKDAA